VVVTSVAEGIAFGWAKSKIFVLAVP